MNTEYVWIGHDNIINLILKVDGVAQDMSDITKITLSIDLLLISSTNLVTDKILWNKGGYAAGEIRLQLGEVSGLAAGRHDAVLTVYDATNTDGIVWGIVPLMIKADPEAA